MTTANIKIDKVLLKRGNSTSSSSYTGVLGEVTMDTTFKTVRVHDGVTVGGTRLATFQEIQDVATGNLDLSGYATTAQITAANANAAAQAIAISSINANLGAFQLYANATFGVGTYSNANVKSYLAALDGNILPAANVVYSLGSATRQWKDLWVSNNTIYINSVPLSISADGSLLVNGSPVTGVGTYGNANVAAYLSSFYTYANVTYSTVANAGAAHSEINGLRANITAANSAIESNYSVFVANAAAAHNEINALRANIIAANSVMTSNAGIQAEDIDSLRANITAANTVISSLQTQIYSNTNVTAYLAGDVTVGNLTTSGFLTTDLQIADNYIQLRSGAANDEINIAPSGVSGAAYLQLPNDATAAQFSTLLHNNAGNVEIGTGDVGNATTWNWKFGNDGTLTLPGYLETQYSINTQGDIHWTNGTGAMVNNNPASEYFLIGVNIDSGTQRLWTFGYAGNMSLPEGGTISYANGVNILDGVGSSYGDANVAAYLIANPQTGTYGNTQVAEYLANFDGTINFTACPAIISTGEITSANVSSTNGYFYGNGVNILDGLATQVSVDANAAAQSIAIDSLNANVGAYQTYANANAAAQSTVIDTKAPIDSPTFTGIVTASGNISAQGNVTVAYNMAVLGNLTVQGTTTTVNATTLSLADKIITVANGSTSNNEANGAGLFVPGSSANILYTSIDDAWTLNKTISGTGNIKAASYMIGSEFVYANGVNILSDLYSNAGVQFDAINNLLSIASGQSSSISALESNATAQAVSINSLTANAATQAAAIDSLNANVGAYQTYANANATTQATSINTITANLGAYQTFANANAAAQATSIGTLTTNAATQQTSINSISANLGAYQAYANTTFSVSSYGNANVAGYLPVYSGNLQAAYITTLGTYGNISGANVISANTFVFGANGVNILSAITAVTANLINGSNVVALLSNGNLLLPNNMNFMSSPAVSTTGIVFGDGTYQRTAYTGPDSVLVNGGVNATLDSAGNLTVPGSILPNTDNVFDLGSATMRFRHLYVGPGTVYVGNAAIKTTVTGNLILPGVTRPVASSAFVEEVETTGDQSYSFATTPTIIDNARFQLLTGGPVSTFTPATYSSSGIDADGYVRNIAVDTAGSGYANDVAVLAEQNMWATEAADPINNFNINDWVQIPFRAETRAGESEYEFGTGGGSGDRLTNNGNEVVLESNGDLTLPVNGAISIDGGDGSIAPDGDDLVISWDNEELILKSVSGDVQVEADNEFTIKVQYDGNDYTGKWTFSNSNELVNIGADTGIVSEGGELRLQGGRDTLSSANVKIVSVNNGVAIHNWTFATTGNVIFPDGTEQSTAYTGGGGGNANTGNVVFDGDQLYVGGTGFLDLRNSDNQVELGSNNPGPVIVSTDEGTHRWEFGADGWLSFPGTFPGGAIGYDDDTQTLQLARTTGVSIYTQSGPWVFGANGHVVFPDNTVQTTAYRNIVQDNLMLDGGAAATIYEVTVDYAEGGFSATRYGVNTPSFNGGAAALDEPIYYTLDGGGA